MATKGGALAANRKQPGQQRASKQPAPEPAPAEERRSFLDANGQWISLAARLLLGAMWLYYCLPKLTQPTQNIADVRDFQILPSGLVQPFAYAQPYLELALGLLLIVGLGTRLVALLSALMLLVYIGGIISLGARGISISCGCGGNGGTVAAGQTRYTLDVLRDVAYLIPAAWLLWKPRSKYSADEVLLPQ